MQEQYGSAAHLSPLLEARQCVMHKWSGYSVPFGAEHTGYSVYFTLTENIIFDLRFRGNQG